MENKLVTKKILEEHGIKVPKGLEYTTATAAKADFIINEIQELGGFFPILKR